MKGNGSMRIVSFKYRWRYKLRTFINKPVIKYGVLAIIILIIGTAAYVSYKPKTNKETYVDQNPLKNPGIMDENLANAITDDSLHKISIDNISTNYNFWQGKNMGHTTKVSGSMLIYGRKEDTSLHKDDTYYSNTPFKTVLKAYIKKNKLISMEIQGISDTATYTGYLSNFLHSILYKADEDSTQETTFSLEKKYD
jgi:hypothetical protein